MLTPKVLPSDITQYECELYKIEKEYRWCYGAGTPRNVFRDSTPEDVKKRYKQLQRKIRDFKRPEWSIFLKNDALYTLWCNRNSSDSITAKELYDIVEGIGRAIYKVEANAAYSSFDGR